MVDFTTKYDQYDLEDEGLDRRGTRKLATVKRDLTGQERYARQARFSRRRNNQASFSGAARRRDKRNYL